MSVIYDVEIFFTNGTKATVRKVTDVRLVASDQPADHPSGELLLARYRPGAPGAETVVAQFRWSQVDGYYLS